MSFIITGAGDGLGKALAKNAQVNGKHVVGIDRAWPEGVNGSDEKIILDLGDLDQCARIVDLIGHHSPFDGIIHNAGISATGAFETLPEEAQSRLIDVNVTAPLLMTQALLNEGLIKEGGTIAFVASLSVFVGYPGASGYAASKAAVANMAQSLRKALKPQKINVLAVYPGPIRTAQAARHAPAGAKEDKRMIADDAARQIFSAISARRGTCVPGLGNRLFAMAGKLAPTLTDKAMRSIIYEKLDRSVY